MAGFKNRPFAAKLGFAVSGLRQAWRGEINFRRQVGIAVAALLALAWLRPPLVWWMLVLLCCGLVLGLELVNTALEALVDWVSPERREIAGRIKDLAAAAVLVAALFSVAVGIGAVWAALRGG